MSAEQSHKVHFHCQANVRPIEPRQSSSHVKQSKNLEETLVQLHELQKPTPPPIVSSGRVDMAGSNMDITANSCESLVDQFLQEREPTALAEGRIAAIIDPHNNLMNRFLNEQEPTAPPADGMNMDLLKQLLNVWEPSALPVMHKKLNRMDGSSTPTQDITMQDMREPMPPPLVSNVPVKSFDLAADEDNGANHLTFGMPEQSEMRDLFEEICNGELPSTQQSLQMEQWGLAPVPHCNQVSHYHGNTTPSDMLFDPTLNRHLVQAVNAIARELGTAARDQYVVHYPHSAFENCPKPFITNQSRPSCQSVVEMGILYLVCWIKVASVHLKQTANIVGWPVHWFANLAMDLNQLNSLILVMVLHASYTPPLLACYHVYLRHQDDELIPLSAFSIIDNINAIVSHWTPHAADPNSGFAFPWWLYHSKEYAVDSQRLQGKGLFSMAWDFFKLMMAQGLWPLPEVPIADCLDGHIKEQVNYCIENIQKYADVVNGWG
ncbi:hypothetical protein F5J12DRAFT_783527 [Pisolithus orientalis]|uniref:uncharacterized protein n=1 Tax=Pisolithus orientalis TaxID=936130 RepID=UPI002223F503|nr:uncharacterized protein F5J12DRAFT_783527 [Pisolithus orientalis]KAI6003456.1 hypothetical protein F5J12DRAFT_783527 [Pisolithus orientalis]